MHGLVTSKGTIIGNCDVFNETDTCCIKLDNKKGLLIVDDECFKIEQDKDINYRLAVTIHYDAQSISITKFTIH